MTETEHRPPALKIGLSTLYWIELSGARDLFQSIVNAMVTHPGHELILLAPPPDIESLHRGCRAVFGRIPKFIRPPTVLIRVAQRAERMIRTRSWDSAAEISARMQRETFAWLGPELLQRVRFHGTDYSPEGIDKAAG